MSSCGGKKLNRKKQFLKQIFTVSLSHFFISALDKYILGQHVLLPLFL